MNLSEMEMGENVAVHSEKHLQYLLEQNVVEGDSNNPGVEHGGMRHNDPYLSEVPTSRPYKSVDILQMGEGNDFDLEWHDEDGKGSNIRFVNQLESQRAEATKETGDENMVLNEESFQYDSNVYSNVQTVGSQQKVAHISSGSSIVLDSLDMTGVDPSFETNEDEIVGNRGNLIELSDSIDDTGVIQPEGQGNNQFEDEMEIANEKSKRQAKLESNISMKKSRGLKAGFKYREPEPKFIVRNKVELGKKTQGSYSQKFLERKSEVSGNTYKQLQLKDEIAHVDDSNKGDLKQQPMQDVLMTGSIGSAGRNNAVSQPMEIKRHGNTNIDIHVLDEMIREEELTLKNHIFDISFQEMPNNPFVVEAPVALDFSAKFRAQSLAEPNVTLATKKSTGNFSYIPKKEDSIKSQTYAQLHSISADKHNQKQTESPLSYAGQHLEKKKKQVSYKKYSLKDYADLNKEIVLQRSLGPDTSSEDYLQKKARAVRLKEYATAVSMQNKEKLIVKKSRSAPAPAIKERMNESKRAAALQYAKNIKNASVSRKCSTNWSVTKQRPSSEKTHEQSAVEIMKERHEAEKLAVEKMRQNLASIIKEVKS